MAFELGVIKLFEGILHVFVTDVLANPSAVFEDVRKAHITSFPHVIF